MQRGYGILLVGWIAGCTAAIPSGEPKSLPDHFNPGLDLLVSETGHPCGSDFNFGGGQIIEHHRFTYDAFGRLQTDVGVDDTGAPEDRIDYSWDNAGHMMKQRDASVASGSLEVTTNLYDTLGRLTQVLGIGSDLDPNDDHQVGNSRSTTTYRDFDELGHAAHSDQLNEDLDAHTSQMWTGSYTYDDLGRQTSIEIRAASGDVSSSEHWQYDDVARTITWQVQLPPLPDPTIATTLQATDQYDDDGHWLSRHQQNLRPDGMVVMLQDVAVTWDADRELSEVTSIYPPDHRFTFRISTTFRYQCDADTSR